MFQRDESEHFNGKALLMVRCICSKESSALHIANILQKIVKQIPGQDLAPFWVTIKQFPLTAQNQDGWHVQRPVAVKQRDQKLQPLVHFSVGSNSMTTIFITSLTVPQKHGALLSFLFLPLHTLFVLPMLGPHLEELLLGSNSKSSYCKTCLDILLHRHVATIPCIYPHN